MFPLSRLDLSDFELIDFHAHSVSRVLVNEVVNERAGYHLDFLHVSNGPIRSRLLLNRQLENQMSPHFLSLIHYIAMCYGCRPTLEDVDRTLKAKYEEDFGKYSREVLDREKIKLVQFAEPSLDFGEFPKERAKWAFRCDSLIQPEWTRKNGAKNIDQAVELVERELKDSASRGCVGIKTCIAYYRGLDLKSVTRDRADRAFKDLQDKHARRHRPHYGLFEFPEYDDEVDAENWKSYIDYITKYIILRCGELDLPFHCHTGGGVAPSMDLRKVNPALMYGLFYDDDIANSNASIVLLHCGVPYIGEAAAAASQFPYVYVDTSWPTRSRTLRDIFSTCLREVSPRKILYGSDCSFIVERLGMGAWTARKMLSEVLSEYMQLGWTENECLESAKLIFSENAKRLSRLD